jgi:hypothetical protein
MARTTQKKTAAPGARGGSAAVTTVGDKQGNVERLAEVDRLLDLVAELPVGHPDRVRLLTDAERILDR